MIAANKIKIEPTIFSDGTSQVWKLPDELVNAWEVNVIWHFESEGEIMHLLSLRRLLYDCPMSLHMPFLPYARQDKKVSNTSTFNLEVFADLLNGMRLSEVTAVDTHNTKAARRLIKNFRNVEPKKFHDDVLNQVDPDYIVFPDKGANDRYNFYPRNVIVMNKERDAITGNILSIDTPTLCKVKGTVLIVDDLCDGGATFIACASALRKVNPDIDIHLAVTHGLFSKGLTPLLDAGITPHWYTELKFKGVNNVH